MKVEDCDVIDATFVAVNDLANRPELLIAESCTAARPATLARLDIGEILDKRFDRHLLRPQSRRTTIAGTEIGVNYGLAPEAGARPLRLRAALMRADLGPPV